MFDFNWRKHLQSVLGVDKATFEFLPLAWIWPITVDQGNQVRKPPELGHLPSSQQNNAAFCLLSLPWGRRCRVLQQASLAYNCWDSWMLQGIWGKSRRRGSALSGRRCTKGQARRSPSGRLHQKPEEKEMFFVLVDVSASAVLTLKAFNEYWVSYLRPEVNHGATVDVRLREKSRTRGQIHKVAFVGVCLGRRTPKIRFCWKMIIVEEPSTPHKCLVVCWDRSTWWTSSSRRSLAASWKASSPSSLRWWSTA